jgi:hypothetical protein
MKALRFTCLLSLVLLTLSVLIFQRTANPGKPAAHQSSSARITAQSLTDQAKRIQLSEAYGKLPLSFEANQRLSAQFDCHRSRTPLTDSIWRRVE